MGQREPIDVLYIAGAGRSGTTLLDQALGRLEGFCSVGEINYFFDAGLGRNQRCACGARLRECEFWAEVLRLAIGELSEDRLREIIDLKNAVVPRVNTLKLAWPKLATAAYNRRRQEYGELVYRLYRSVLDVSGAHTVVDSSKDPGYGFFLSSIPGFRLKVVHVVRDPRAVAFSRLQQKKKTSLADADEYMPITPVYITAVKWSLVNILAEWLGRRVGRYQCCRYEDVVSFFDETLSGLVEFGGLDQLAVLTANQDAKLHTSLGNPSKSANGPQQLMIDDRWELQMRAGDRKLVYCLTYPLLSRYDYL